MYHFISNLFSLKLIMKKNFLKNHAPHNILKVSFLLRGKHLNLYNLLKPHYT